MTEDVAVDSNGVLVASGQLSITDPDADQDLFNAATISGAHGSLTIGRAVHGPMVASNLPEVQSLGAIIL